MTKECPKRVRHAHSVSTEYVTKCLCLLLLLVVFGVLKKVAYRFIFFFACFVSEIHFYLLEFGC